ncbi:UTP--glucose-1-phosphate uridylyltransferase [Nostocoides sp. F2B08]|uniref:UTP--glucose-1-phosphate uridylyltransferase n=1 Tax=Nostocoides sp. F2B08 TaxID=2653936 RepID=UPI001D03B281|nr:UTP--glucose-1-phosphate uridylyltransferase [Tetrasphaera sp. F2B08]
MSHPGLHAALDLMRAAGESDQAMAVFATYHAQLQAGHTGTIPEDSIRPLTDVPELGDVAVSEEERRDALARTVVLKLNGGLGTSMGMKGPKSLVPVRDGLTFLDIVARQVLALRRRYDVDLPLLLMHSFSTREPSLEALSAYPDLQVGDLPLDILQNREPKLTVDDLAPVSWPANPDLEWCPPGHGDVYVSLLTSGVLERLREQGYETLFLSNIDNLGATCDPDIAAWMRAEGAPYVAEVCERTHNDRKGGHLAVRRSDGRLVLRDNGAVAPGEMEFFQDTELHSTFHTNNLWVSIERLHDQLTATGGVLGLPMIANHKTVDPTDRLSTPVVQIESAMGSAIEIFEGSRAIGIPRTRFRPVKTTNELLLMQSDIYDLTDGYELVSTIDHPEPYIDLGPTYALIDDFSRHFPHGAPSLRDCETLRIRGDLTFGAGVRCVSDVDVVVEHPAVVPDGAVLTRSGAEVIEPR